jgi:sec-independent protein translocase protein TatA
VPNVGIGELIVIFLILVVVFGASRLPQLGESVGRTIRNFKRGMATDESIEVRTQEPPVGACGTASAKPSADPIEDAEVIERKS